MEKMSVNPIAAWQFEVLNDFSGVVITLRTLLEGGTGPADTRPLKPIGLTLHAARQLAQDLASVVAHMETRGKTPAKH